MSETMGEFNRTKGKMVDDFKAIARVTMPDRNEIPSTEQPEAFDRFEKHFGMVARKWLGEIHLKYEMPKFFQM